jgi:hypothetical protein
MSKRLSTAIALCLFALTATAHAQSPDPDYWKQDNDRRQAVYALMYAESPQTIPAGYDPVQEAQEILRQHQRGLPPTNPKSPSIWRQLRDVTARAGLSRPLSALGTVGLAAGAFEIGWKIGSGPVAKFFRIGLPEPPYNPGFSNPRMTWLTPGAAITHGGVAPTAGFYLHMDSGGGAANGFLRASGDVGACELSFDPAPGGAWADVVTAMASCFQGYGKPIGFREVHTYRLVGDGISRPAEDYTDQPYDRVATAPTAPPQITVEAVVDDALDDPANGDLRDWINFHEGSPGAADPTGAHPNNPTVPFPKFREKWKKHSTEFPEYADEFEYWREAVKVLERGRQDTAGYDYCIRQRDGSEIAWDEDNETIVIFRDGVIETYFAPEDGRDYFDGECAQ